MMAPMACSRMPKCRFRPPGVVVQVSVVISSGPKEGSPLMKVLLDPARSAEPPHSSGRVFPRACRVASEAFRVATDSPTSQVGRSASNPSGSFRAASRSNRALPSGLAAAHWSTFFCHAACFSAPRSASFRVWASTASSMKKSTSGSNPSASLVAFTSSAPRAAPCTEPVFILVGAGNPMTVRTRMKEGRVVSACASATACSMAVTFSPAGTSSTCHP